MGVIESPSCADRGAAVVALEVLIAEAARGRGGPLYEGVDDEGASPDLGARFLCWVACCWKWVHSRFLVTQWTQRSVPGTRLHLTLRARQASHAVFCLRPSIALGTENMQRVVTAVTPSASSVTGGPQRPFVDRRHHDCHIRKTGPRSGLNDVLDLLPQRGGHALTS